VFYSGPKRSDKREAFSDRIVRGTDLPSYPVRTLGVSDHRKKRKEGGTEGNRWRGKKSLSVTRRYAPSLSPSGFSYSM